LNDDEHGEDLGLEHGDVLKVEGNVEEGEEGVDELEEDQLEDDVPGRRLGRFDVK
jgi:hypothetical protein